MMSPDLQRIAHFHDYCIEIRNTIERYGKNYLVFDTDPDYQRSIAFSILQIGELAGKLSDEYESGGAGAYFTGDDYMKFANALANGGCGILSPSAIERMRTPLLDKHNRERFRTLLGFPGYTYGTCVRVMDEPEKCGFVTPKGEFGWQGKGGTYCSICPELNTAIFMGIQICDYHPVNIVMHNELREKIYSAVLNGEM